MTSSSAAKSGKSASSASSSSSSSSKTKNRGGGLHEEKGYEILLKLLEKLSGLINITHPIIRDAVCEAILSLAKGLIPSCQTLKEAVMTASRQIAAEQQQNGNHQNNNKHEKNPKLKAFEAQKAEYSQVKSLFSLSIFPKPFFILSLSN